MVHKIAMALAVLLASATAQNATTGLPAPQMVGIGPPAVTCSATNFAGVSYIQSDASSSKRIWMCNNSSGSYAWENLSYDVLGAAAAAVAAIPSAPTLRGMAGFPQRILMHGVAGPTVVNTTAVMSLATTPTIGTRTFPVGYFSQAGQTVKLVADARFGTATIAPGLTAIVNFAGQTFSGAAPSLAAGLANAYGSIDVEISVESISGTTVTARLNGHAYYTSGTGGQVSVFTVNNSGATFTFQNSVPQSFSLSAQWTAASTQSYILLDQETIIEYY